MPSMPTMIPAEISTDNRFERDLFEKFKKIPANWTILHSVSVGTGSRQPRELDFVILIPESYSVVYLEAKGGRYSIRDRKWFRDGEAVGRIPTEQASSGMYELKNKFTREHPQYSGSELWLSFSCAVAFTDWDIAGEATRQADVTKGALLMGGGDVQDGNRMYQLLREHTNEVRNNFDSTEDWNDLKRKLAGSQLIAMVKMLNPPPTPVTSNTFFRHNLDTLLPELLEPTPSQTTALTLIKGNDRCVIDGAAGTGKTVLAMESVRQRCEQDGDTVALLCSNPLLSSRFERWADEKLSAEQGGRAMAGTPASLLARAFADDPSFLSRHQQRMDALPNLERALKRGDLDNGWRGFVENTLQELEGKPAVFDYLVIDEAQNLCDDVFLRLLDKLLKGGLAHGRWTMFGDFTNQNIVTPRRGDREYVYKVLADFGASNTRWRLDTNCRNTYEIAAATYDTTDIGAPTLPGLHGPDVEYRYFDSNDQLHDLLEKQLAEWDRRGFESRQIIILSSGDDNIFDQNRQYGKWKLVNIADAPSGSDVMVSSDDSPYVRFSNIFDFQGLESNLVILVLPIAPGQTKVGGVVTLPYVNYLTRLLYIAMSRANAMLIVMADEGYKAHLQPETLRFSPPNR